MSGLFFRLHYPSSKKTPQHHKSLPIPYRYIYIYKYYEYNEPSGWVGVVE